MARRTMPQQKPGESRQDYETPEDFLQAVEARWGKLDIDLAATHTNAKASEFITIEENSLKQNWAQLAHAPFGFRNFWLNPPFSDINSWSEKCAATLLDWVVDGFDARARTAPKIFLLVPASVGANWFQRHLRPYARTYEVSPRMKFVGEKDPYPKDLVLAVYGDPPGVEGWRYKP